MAKRTVPELAEFIAETTGLSDSNLRTISRRLREAEHLSQFGHGRGAATATPKDAALILLVAAAEVPPLHSVAMGEALLACGVPNEAGAFEQRKRWPSKLPLADSAVEQVATVIEGGHEIHEVTLFMNIAIRIQIVAQDAAVIYGGEADSPANEKLWRVLGRSNTISRIHQISNQVLHDISGWLREVEDNAE